MTRKYLKRLFVVGSMGLWGFVPHLSAQMPDTLWTKTFGGAMQDYGKSIQQTSDGGFIITGGTNSVGAGATDVLLIRTDASGDTLWVSTFGGNQNDEGTSVLQTPDGGFLVCGSTKSLGAGDYDALLMFADSAGNTLWYKTYGGTLEDRGTSVRKCSTGGYIISGVTKSFGAGGFDVFLIRTDTNGDTLWTRTFGGSGQELTTDIEETLDGGYVVTGFTTSFGDPFFDVLLIRTDAFGDTLWTKTFGGSEFDYGTGVELTSDSGYAVAGWTYSSQTGNANPFLLRTTASGDTLWTRTFEKDIYEVGNGLATTNDGGFIITGTSRLLLDVSQEDVLLIRTDYLGDTLWTKTIGENGFANGLSVRQTSDGGYVVVGAYAAPTGGFTDALLIRLGSENPTDVQDQLPVLPVQFLLSQNYPNPFNPTTTFEYHVSDAGFVTLKVYDLLGRETATLVNENVAPGSYLVQWNGTDHGRQVASSGVYLYRLTAGSRSLTGKMLLMK